MRSLRFSTLARKDLSEIAERSQAQWGRDQRRRYIGEILRRLTRLRARPRLGQPFVFLGPEVRRLIVGQHIAFYEFDDQRVRVLRILDQRMNLEAHAIHSNEP